MTNECEELNQYTKPSICYACGQLLRSYSMLVCTECLDSECEKFAFLAQGSHDSFSSDND